MRYIIISMIFGAAIISACSKTFDSGTTTAVKVSNEWWVNDKGGDIVKITTYNTASNPDSIWVNSLDTVGTGYRFNCKAKIDLTTYEFSAQNSQNVSVHQTNAITITKGKILPNATTVGDGELKKVADSIYLELQYSDDPGNTYVIKGHARTMWDVDEY